MIAIVVLAILGALAGPTFVTYIATQRIRNASYDLVAALQMARSEAIKRNAGIDVVRAASAWSNGWTVQVPGSPAVVLRSQDAYANVAISNTANLTTISYGNDGRATTATTIFKIEPTAANVTIPARCVTIGLSGVATSKVGGC
jgi:type IV fimbrial biogenesis protein FimT